MTTYKAIEGQSLWDVCLQTYGTFDLMAKLLQDNNIDSINFYPFSGQVFSWDETQTANQFVNISSTNANIIYATKALKNGSVFGIVLNGAGGGNGGGGVYHIPDNPNNNTMVKYQKTAEVQYTATGGETSVVLTDLINSTIVQITREIKPLFAADYSLNINTGLLTLNNGIVLDAGETLFIIYGKIITS